MALEDFEKQLVEEKEAERRRERRKEHSRSIEDRHQSSHRHHHHHRSSKHRDSHYDNEDHHSKRPRRDDDEDDRDERRRHRHRRKSHGEREAKDDGTVRKSSSPGLRRDSWMEAPSAIDVDYIHRKKKEPSPPPAASLGADLNLKIHEKELNHHLRDLENGKSLDELEDESAPHEVDYTFGDAGSQWRMTRLKTVYRQAKESGRKVDEVALERFGNLREFDDAREEEIELDRRQRYGPDYVGKEKPSGELFQDRKMEAGIRRDRKQSFVEDDPSQQVQEMAVPAPSNSTNPKLDQTALNKLKAQLMKAQLRKDTEQIEILQKQYDEATATFSSAPSHDPTLVTLSAMDNRMLSSAPRNEVKSVQNRRGAERGQVEENEEMSIEDMVREERRNRGQQGGEGQKFAERIAKDAKFDNDLEYLDENASKLARRVHKSDLNLRNVAINEYQKLNKILENCPLCHHEDRDLAPAAPVVSLATKTYLTLPTEPELSPQSTMIVPLQHHTNLLECDDDEWEELRNFMKALTRFYHDQGRDVIFYENAAHPHRKPHAALTVVPLPYSLGETAPAFFKEAFLTTEGEWSQHKKIIDTLTRSKPATSAQQTEKKGWGRLSFRRSLAKEMPYFHVWFELDGGLGHVVEEPDRWPRGDLFAREIVGGMLGLEPDVVKKQGRWVRGAYTDRVEAFRKRWRKFDWTRILTD